MPARLCRGLLALPVLLVAGCVVNQDLPYPASWPPISGRTSADCSDLDGSYVDNGEAHTLPIVNPSLAFNLGWQGWSGTTDRDGWRQARRVVLAVRDPGSLEADIRGTDGKQIAQHVLTRASGEFACDSGHATVRWHASGEEDLLAGRDDYTIELSRSGEYLVAHVHDRAIGLIGLVIPVAGSNNGWVRFPRLPH